MLCTSFEFLNLHENTNFGSVFQDSSLKDSWLEIHRGEIRSKVWE
jgi:hypothetical protein